MVRMPGDYKLKRSLGSHFKPALGRCALPDRPPSVALSCPGPTMSASRARSKAILNPGLTSRDAYVLICNRSRNTVVHPIEVSNRK